MSTGPDGATQRVSDGERKSAADRLGAAFAEGRLQLLEYDERIGRAFAAVTRGELAQVLADLPHPDPPPDGDGRSPAHRSGLRAVALRLPLAVRVLWLVLAAVLATDMVLWVLLSIGNGSPLYFWPMWLSVPAALLATVSGLLLRSDPGARRTDPTREHTAHR